MHRPSNHDPIVGPFFAEGPCSDRPLSCDITGYFVGSDEPGVIARTWKRLDADRIAKALNAADETADLRTQLDEVIGERDALRSDIDDSIRDAKQSQPDYPWDDSPHTAREALWAIDQALKGVRAANKDWEQHADKLRAQRDVAIQALRTIANRLHGEPYYVQQGMVKVADKAIAKATQEE